MRLLSFSVANYRSFFDEQTITFDQGVNNVDAIFGPNGSGKSNLFMAIGFFRNFIQTSTKFEGQAMQYLPFLFNSESESLPTCFKAEMQTKSHVYRYHFSLLKGEIADEVLSRKGLSDDATYTTIFSRKSLDKNRYVDYGFDSALLRKTRNNSLVLTKAWENNNKYALDVFTWLDHLKLVSGDEPAGQTAQKITEDEDFKIKLLDLLRRADLYIQDVSAQKVNLPDEIFDSLPIAEEFKKTMDRTSYNVTTTHMLRNNNGMIIGTRQLPIALESAGTRRIFELAFPLIDTLEKGNVLYIDEYETHLHPRECEFIVKLFKSSDNAGGAQLIVNTHDTQMMGQIGRNNIHLFGKNSKEETAIGSIPKDVRIDDPALEKKYNKGVFGAVPNIEK